MRLLPKILCRLACFISTAATAQQSFNIQLPDVQIFADRVVRGDGDTYGLGDWRCTFSVALDSERLKLDGKIFFTEKANDFTTIVGEFRQSFFVRELANCHHCSFSLAETRGAVSGPNIGARGFRWFEGQGIVGRANIQTDTFGKDAGNIGGTVQFVPIRVLVKLLRA